MPSSDDLSMSTPFLVVDRYVFVASTTGRVKGDNLKIRHVDQLTVKNVSRNIA